MFAVCFASNEKVHETSRQECALMAMDHPMTEKRRMGSPFMTLAFVTFMCAFSTSIFLILYTAVIL